jgi:hypothetical protein
MAAEAFGIEARHSRTSRPERKSRQSSTMHHSRHPARAVSNSVRVRARKYGNGSSSNGGNSTVHLEDPTASSTSAAVITEVSSPPPAYEPSWRRTGRSSMAAAVRIPSFLIPCSAGQLMDARYKSRQFSRATASKAVSPAA